MRAALYNCRLFGKHRSTKRLRRVYRADVAKPDHSFHHVTRAFATIQVMGRSPVRARLLAAAVTSNTYKILDP